MSLISLLIGMLVGLLAMAGTMTVYVTTVHASSDNLKLARLNQDLRNAIGIMADDIRRAGYWANAASDVGADSNNNPFMVATNDIRINADGDCILFSYDLDDDGALGTGSGGSADERFGFRFNRASGSAEMAVGSTSCTAGDWQAITSGDLMEVTGLSFTPTDTVLDADGSIGSATLTIRRITITIDGRLRNEPGITRSHSRTVRVRNDRFQS